MTIAIGVSSLGHANSATQVTAGVTTQASGSTFVVFGAFDSGFGATFTSFTDSKGNTYTQIDTEVQIGGGAGTTRARVYYCQNGTGGASHTATMTISQAENGIILFAEITGGLTSGILDQHGFELDSATPFQLTTGLTTTQASELLLTGMIGNSGSNPATHAETGLGSSSILTSAEETNGASFYTGALAWSVKSSTGTFNPSWTESGGTTGLTFLATFKGAGGGGGSQLGQPWQNQGGLGVMVSM